MHVCIAEQQICKERERARARASERERERHQHTLVCIYVRVYACKCMHVYMRVCMCVCMYVCVVKPQKAAFENDIAATFHSIVASDPSRIEFVGTGVYYTYVYICAYARFSLCELGSWAPLCIIIWICFYCIRSLLVSLFLSRHTHIHTHIIYIYIYIYIYIHIEDRAGGNTTLIHTHTHRDTHTHTNTHTLYISTTCKYIYLQRGGRQKVCVYVCVCLYVCIHVCMQSGGR
jgi:hypothetical protein